MSLLKTFKPLLIGIVGCVISIAITENWITNRTSENIAANFEQKLRIKADTLSKAIDQVWHAKNSYLTTSFNLSTGSIFVYSGDSLTYWSDHSVPVSNKLSTSGIAQGLNKLKNGWYYALIKKEENKTVIGLISLKRNYAFQNRFLSNEFNSDFQLPLSWELAPKLTATHLQQGEKNNVFEIKNPAGPSFYLTPASLTKDSLVKIYPVMWSLLVGLYLAVTSLSLLLVFRACSYMSEEKGASLAFATIGVATVLVRYFLQSHQIPSSLYLMPIFSPSIYGSSSLFPSLGDLLINLALGSYLLYFIRKNIQINITPKKKQSNSSYFLFIKENLMGCCLGCFVFIVALMCSLFLPSYFHGLIANSKISFNLNNLFELDAYSFCGFLCIGIALYCYYLILDTAYLWIKGNRKIELTCFAIGSTLYLFVCLVFAFGIWQVIFPIVLSGVVFFWKTNTENEHMSSPKIPLLKIVGIIALMSIFSAYQISGNLNQKEQTHRQVLAQKLSIEKDPVAEYLYEDLYKSLIEDSTINNLSTLTTKNEEWIKTTFLGGYWEKYDLQITLCHETDSINIQPDNVTRNCFDFFNEEIEHYGSPTSIHNFYFRDNSNGRISYLAKLTLKNSVCFIEFDSKLIPQSLGFPELLMDKNIDKQLLYDLKQYSYAKYQNGILVENMGSYNYRKKERLSFLSKNFFQKLNGYSHLVFPAEENTVILLSKKDIGVLDSLIQFSYLFSFFCLLGIVYTLISSAVNNRKKTTLTFKRRIELAMAFILLVSLMPIVIGTKLYLENQHNNSNKEQLQEKLQSVLVEIEHKLSKAETLSIESKDYLSYLLTKFSYVFFSDINIYDINGSLLASSRPEIFSYGLIGEKIHPVAFASLSNENKTEIIQKESIGKLTFLSAYSPFKNEQGKIIAYLNLPYFAKEGKIRKEISALIVALINFYVLLSLIGIGTALIVSNKITQPLRILQDKFSRIGMGLTNEKIFWENDDEFGALVSEYNRMLKELEKSAIKLTKAERESAWREMAKQVAHEIKNPLTPMKLSIQHLEKAYHDNAPDWEERLEKFSKTLIGQINTLSSIAEEFSHFAKMPKANNQIIEIEKTISDTIELFKNNLSSNAVIKFKTESTQHFVFADKDQLTRVLNNLLTNSLQATEGNKNGEIVVKLFAKEKNIIISISDNGKGIKEIDKENIFSPNFTTKNSGMGLGLTMVKNIVNYSGGDVWFESDEGIGTCFYFSLPKHVS